MATGPEHYREAEELLDLASTYDQDSAPVSAERCRRDALVHALLANAAATALNDHSHDGGGMPLEDYDAWVNVAAVWQPKRKAGES